MYKRSIIKEMKHRSRLLTNYSSGVQNSSGENKVLLLRLACILDSGTAMEV